MQESFLPLYMCNLINEEQMCLDVVSGGELYTAYKSNFPMEKFSFMETIRLKKK